MGSDPQNKCVDYHLYNYPAWLPAMPIRTVHVGCRGCRRLRSEHGPRDVNRRPIVCGHKLRDNIAELSIHRRYVHHTIRVRVLPSDVCDLGRVPERFHPVERLIWWIDRVGKQQHSCRRPKHNKVGIHTASLCDHKVCRPQGSELLSQW